MKLLPTVFALCSAASLLTAGLLVSQALDTEPSPLRVERANTALNYGVGGFVAMSGAGIAMASRRRAGEEA